MQILEIVVIVALSLSVLYYLLSQKITKTLTDQKNSNLMPVLDMLQNSAKQDREALLTSLTKNTQHLNEKLDTAAKIMWEVQKNVGEVSEIGRSMKDFQEFLKSPKIRGNIGEYILNELLAQLLPKSSFHIQYAFKSGEKVDAAIVTANGIIPVDAKFPLENFRKLMESKTEDTKKESEKLFVRDVKLHIDSISKKYILPNEGTIDYALMYVPSEALYYEIANNPNLFEYAGEKRVLPVSPSTLYAYLRSILVSLEGQKVQEKAIEILKTLKGLKKDYEKVEENLSILQKHLTNANNMLTQTSQSFKEMGTKIDNSKNLSEEEKISLPKENLKG